MGRIGVSSEDFLRVIHSDFLNDNIIDFMLKYGAACLFLVCFVVQYLSLQILPAAILQAVLATALLLVFLLLFYFLAIGAAVLRYFVRWFGAMSLRCVAFSGSQTRGIAAFKEHYPPKVL